MSPFGPVFSIIQQAKRVQRELTFLLLAMLLAGCGAGSNTEPAPGGMMSRTAAQIQQALVSLPGKRDDYTLVRVADGLALRHNTSAAVTHVPMNARLRFADFSYSMDGGSNVAKAYRLYKAAFNRIPDLPGLSYWITAMDKGTSLNDIAQAFVSSNEYRQVYGSNPTDAETVSRYYRNVLGREGEAGGVAFWVNTLGSKGASVAEVLAGFSESAENQAGVGALTGQGIAFREPGIAYAMVANAGASRNVPTGAAITLDGSSSLGTGTDSSLSYRWSIVEQPAGSSAQLSKAETALPGFTPDKAGSYRFSLLVSDGVSSASATIQVIAAEPGLGFVPLDARYSRSLDKVVTISATPNVLSIIDPFSGAVDSVALLAKPTNLNLSRDGKLAIVLYSTIISLVDLETRKIAASYTIGGAFSAAFVTDTGIAYLVGTRKTLFADIPAYAFNARTGVVYPPPDRSSWSGLFYGVQNGIFSALNNKGFVVSDGLNPSDINYFEIDPVSNALIGSGESPYHGEYPFSPALYLSEKEDLVFSAAGNYHRTSDLRHAGQLKLESGEWLASLSNLAAADETLAMALKGTGLLLSSYKVYKGPALSLAATVKLPVVDGKQTYGVHIWHSASGRPVVLVQHGSAAPPSPFNPTPTFLVLAL